MAGRIVQTLKFLTAASLWPLVAAGAAEELPPLPEHGLDFDFHIPEPPQDLSLYDHPRPLTVEPLMLRARPGGPGAGARQERPSVVVRPPGALAERQRRQEVARTEAMAGPVPHYSSLPELRYSSPANIASGYLSSEPIVSVAPMAGELAAEEARLLAEAAQRRLAQGSPSSPALRRVVLIAEVDDPLMALARMQRQGEPGRFVAGVDLELPNEVLAEIERYQGQELSPETTLELVESLMMSMRRNGRNVSEVRIVDESLARGEIALMLVEPQG